MSKRSNARSHSRANSTSSSNETTITATNMQATTTISKNPNLVSLPDQIRLLPLKDETWHVVVNEIHDGQAIGNPRRRSDVKQYSVSLIATIRSSSDKAAKPDRTQVMAKGVVKGTSQGPNPDEVLEFLLNYMVDSTGKPQNLAFENESVYNNVAYLMNSGQLVLPNRSSSTQYVPNNPDFNDQIYIQSIDQLKRTKSVDLPNDTGLTIKLVQKTTNVSFGGSMAKRDGTQMNELYASRTSTRTRIKVTTKPAPWYKNTTGMSIISILFLVTLGLGFYTWRSRQNNNWPLDFELIQTFETNLKETLPADQHYAITSLKESIELHNGRKALALHLVGKVPKRDVVRQISRLLFGSEENDRVLNLQGTNEADLKTKVGRHLKRWPHSVVVIDNPQNPKEYDFLTAVLDENYPSLEYEGKALKTNQLVVVMISSDISASEVSALIAKNDLEDVDNMVKKHMKAKLWPDRVIQRLRNVIPFV